MPNNYMYRGEQYDSDLGLYYLRARYYNSLTGRFLSRDPEAGKPADPKTLHKYLYAGGNPVNAKDPTGRDDFDEYGYVIPSQVDEIASINRFFKVVLKEDQCIRWALAWMAGTGGDPGSAWLMFQYCMGGF
jgi:RHS repeat-associated protein